MASACSKQLQKQGIIVRPMGGYQLPEWIRISIGTPEENARCINYAEENFGQVITALASAAGVITVSRDCFLRLR